MDCEAGLSNQSGACAGGRRRKRQRGSKCLSLLGGSWGPSHRSLQLRGASSGGGLGGFCHDPAVRVTPATCLVGPGVWSCGKETGITDHLTCLLKNLYVGKEATVRTEHETADWFQIRKGVCQGCILPPCLFNFYASCEILGWMRHNMESRLLWEISITWDMQMAPPFWQTVKRH